MVKKQKIAQSSESSWGAVGPINWRVAILIFALTIFAYSAALNCGFIWDDDSYVTQNLKLRSVEGLHDIWFKPGSTAQYYPLVFTNFWIQYHLWGLNPLGYHLVNVLLHLVNALLLWFVLKRLRVPGAFWAASIFALHPVQVESAAWITELKNVQSGMFYFLSLLFYFKFLESDELRKPKEPPHWGMYAVSFLFLVCALLSKTVTASLPAVILLILWWKRGKFSWTEAARLLPFFITAFCFGRFTAWLEKYHVGAQGAEWAFSFVERSLIAGRAAWFYFGKVLWPHPIMFTYPRWDINANQWAQYLFPAGVLVAVLILWRTRKRIGRGPLAATLFFLGTLFPALGFLNVYPMRFSFVADHFQYLASIGTMVLFCAVIHRGLKKIRWLNRWPEYLLLACLLSALAFLTWKQGRTYVNSITVFTDVINKNPRSWMAHNNRGVEFFSRKMPVLALADFNKALELRPDYTEAYNNRGLVYMTKGDFEPAITNFEMAIKTTPQFAMGYGNRGYVYQQQGKPALALADYNRAVKLNPNYTAGYNRRGSVFASQGKLDLALADFNRAISINPEDSEGYMNRGKIYAQKGDPDRALKDYDLAVKYLPSNAQAYYFRAQVYAFQKDFQAATVDLLRARQFGYAVPEAVFKNITTQFQKAQ